MKEKVNLFYSVFVFHLGIRLFFQYFQEGEQVQLALAWSFLIIAAIRFFVPLAIGKLMTSLATCAMLFFIIWNTIPTCSNHLYVEFIISVFFLLYDSSLQTDEERKKVIINGVIAIAAFVFIASGLQKIAAGTYFNTSFIAFQIRINDLFADNLRFIIPGDVARITSQPGTEPFYLEQLIGRLMSYSVPVLEVIGGSLLVFKRTKIVGFTICLATIIGIEVIAREFLFGMLYLLSISLVLPNRYFSHIAIFAMAAYIILIATHFTFPNFFFN